MFAGMKEHQVEGCLKSATSDLGFLSCGTTTKQINEPVYFPKSNEIKHITTNMLSCEDWYRTKSAKNILPDGIILQLDALIWQKHLI